MDWVLRVVMVDSEEVVDEDVVESVLRVEALLLVVDRVLMVEAVDIVLLSVLSVEAVVNVLLVVDRVEAVDDVEVQVEVVVVAAGPPKDSAALIMSCVDNNIGRRVINDIPDTGLINVKSKLV